MVYIFVRNVKNDYNKKKSVSSSGKIWSGSIPRTNIYPNYYTINGKPETAVGYKLNLDEGKALMTAKRNVDGCR